MSTQKNRLSVQGLCKSYRMGTTVLEVLNDADFEVQAGEFIAIVGASGS